MAYYLCSTTNRMLCASCGAAEGCKHSDKCVYLSPETRVLRKLMSKGLMVMPKGAGKSETLVIDKTKEITCG